MALFKMPCQQGKAGQQTEQVGQCDPFMSQMSDEAGQSGTRLETAEKNLVETDRDQPRQGNVQGCVMKQCDAQQR
ncbi:hypothetical protein SDC9_130103 [bioreactor metagenome]|uniref:Uncharacterized protein n=1 Tax=bioreactor metagenome TaxID=1076179 RepID=A0A645D0K3_9ZZZZ